jgi:CxxC motif-containing protein (DUF1111 family)
MRRLASALVMLGLQAPLFAQTPFPAATEAPAGFDTPTLILSPGSKSSSNGMAEAAGDTFALDQQVYEIQHDVNSGLGPIYNGRACAECHQNPVSGGASQFTELRIGHRDQNGNFVNPTVPIDDGAAKITGRSILNDRAVVPEAQEHIPATENIRALRAALNTLGDGFVESIPDATLLAIAAQQPLISGGRIRGEAIEVPIFEAPGQTRVGRFGWKDQHGSLLSFIADAYLNEMGVTSRLRPTDTTTIGKVTTDPEDKPDSIGLADIDHFAAFIRGTKVPPRDATLASTADALEGELLFASIGCGACHVSSLTTAPAGTVIDGGMFVVPAALANKIIHPYSDFLLHDIETGDGIVQAGPQDTANKLRTAPLWGLRMRPRYMHDLLSPTLENAIERHQGEAHHVTERFFELPPAERQRLLTFLNSL